MTIALGIEPKTEVIETQENFAGSELVKSRLELMTNDPVTKRWDLSFKQTYIEVGLFDQEEYVSGCTLTAFWYKDLGNVGQIYNLIVAPKFRGQGYSKKIIAAVLLKCENLDFIAIQSEFKWVRQLISDLPEVSDEISEQYKLKFKRHYNNVPDEYFATLTVRKVK